MNQDYKIKDLQELTSRDGIKTYLGMIKIDRKISSCLLCRKAGLRGGSACSSGKTLHPHLDHTERWVESSNGEELVVFHPYEFGGEEIRLLLSFCEANGLSFYIRGDSTYNPGFTSMIVIHNKED